jgi:Flp pilus assembly CpaE family ATPase
MLRVVVNRHQSSDVLSLADGAELLGRAVFHTLPNDYRGSAAAMSAGVAVGQHDANSRLAAAYGALAARLTGAPAVPGTNGTGRGRSRLGKIFGLKRS